MLAAALRNALAIALALALGGVALETFAAPDVDDPALRTQITKLDNGLTVLLLPDPATPGVSFQMPQQSISRP